jgi:hypothetical protein
MLWTEGEVRTEGYISRGFRLYMDRAAGEV